MVKRVGGKLLKSAAIYGANSSGKSNLLKALSFMVRFIESSATRMNEGDEILGVTPFRLAPETVGQPSTFAMTFSVGKEVYDYGFEATSERVWKEWLTCFPQSGSSQRWLERKPDPDSDGSIWEFDGPLKNHGETIETRTRTNGLALSRGAEQNIQELGNIYLWFKESLWSFDLSEPPRQLREETAQEIHGDPEFKKRVAKLLRDADLGFDDISVRRKPLVIPEEVRKLLPENLQGAAKEAVHFQVTTQHSSPVLREPVHMDLEWDESKGTQRFFALAGPILDALEKGAAIVVDEIGCSMHPLLTRKLIELFLSPKMNKEGAQLIFATHDSTLMDETIFRRDQLWLAEKRADGATELGSFLDIAEENRPRSTERFQRNYLAGRYGGVPNFGPALEDQEV